MSIKVITWNMYFGKTDEVIPVQRFNRIVQLADENEIDVIFLQEHPGATSRYVNPNDGQLRDAEPLNYGYFVYPEMLPNRSRVRLSNRSYAVLLRNTCVITQEPAYWKQDSFRNQQGTSFLRCPLHCQIQKTEDTTYNFFQWHNEVFNADVSLLKFIQTPLLENTVLLGDLNVSEEVINEIDFFDTWQDVVVPGCVDHILSPLNCNPLMGDQLDFRSDHHFPIAAEIKIKNLLILIP